MRIRLNRWLCLLLMTLAAGVLAATQTAPIESALTLKPPTLTASPVEAGHPGAGQPGAGQSAPGTTFNRTLETFVPSQEVDTDQAVDFPTNI
jgi:hypothetical protein